MKQTKIIIAAILCVLILVPNCFKFSAFAKGSILSKEDFAAGVSNAIKENKSNKNKAVSIQSTDDNCSLRLYGKTADVSISFSGYHPDDTFVCEDGRFFLDFLSKSDAEKCKQSLQKDSKILFVCSDTPIYTNEIEETESHLSYGPELMNTDSFCEAYANTEHTESIVAVIDSGAANIDYLYGHLTQGYDFVDNDNDTSNDTHPNSHGTFLSSEIVDCVGAMPVKIMPIRVLSSISGSLINAINGIHYAVDNGANIINISLGGKLDNCEAVEDAVAYAINNNVTVVVCSGNEHDDTKKYCPAHIPDAITVSSVNSENAFASSFSNYGEEVDFAAPGVDINGYNASGKLKTLSGTSMSTAFVSAAVAIVRSANPALNSKQIFSFLKQTCDDRGEEGWDPYYGWGTINLQQAHDINHVWVNGVYLNERNISMEIGSQKELICTIMPEDATVQNVNWVCENSEVVTIDAQGTIYAKGTGKTQITVVTEDGEYKDTCQIEVHKKTPKSITITKLPDKLSYKYGEKLSVDGMTVEANYSNYSDVIDNNELVINGYANNKTGEQVVTISYLECETSFKVRVQRTWWQMIIRILSLRWVWDFLKNS